MVIVYILAILIYLNHDDGDVDERQGRGAGRAGDQGKRCRAE